MVARKHNAAGASRGGIAKRRTAVRADRDGDLVMEASARGRGGITKSRGMTHSARDHTARPGRTPTSTARLQSEVQRHVSSNDKSIKAPRGLEEVRVTGWKGSKASSNPDGGVTSLVAFLEKRATLKNPTKRPVKVKKVCQQLLAGRSSYQLVALGPLSFAVNTRTTTACQRPGILSFG